MEQMQYLIQPHLFDPYHLENLWNHYFQVLLLHQFHQYHLKHQSLLLNPYHQSHQYFPENLLHLFDLYHLSLLLTLH